jgi:hypothetical protein
MGHYLHTGATSTIGYYLRTGSASLSATTSAPNLLPHCPLPPHWSCSSIGNTFDEQLPRQLTMVGPGMQNPSILYAQSFLFSSS